MSIPSVTLTNDFYQTWLPAKMVGKQRATITLPAFTLTFDWARAEVSTIVGVYNYAATKSFTISTIPAEPDDLNFILCIKYRLTNGTTKRYKLWGDSEGAILNVDQYAGQIIRKNFQLEIWSLDEDNETVTLDDDTEFLLSILQIRTSISDDDTYEESAASTLVTDLLNTNSASAGSSITLAQAFPLTISPEQQLFGYYRASDLANGPLTNWPAARTNLSGVPEVVTDFNGTGLPPTVMSNDWSINNKKYANMLGGSMYAGSANFIPFTILDEDGNPVGVVDEQGRVVLIVDGSGNVTQYAQTFLVMVIRQNNWTLDNLLWQKLGATSIVKQEVRQSATTPELKYSNTAVNSGATLSRWCILEAWYDLNNFVSHLRITNLKTGAYTEVTSAPNQIPTEFLSLILGDAASDYDLAAFGIYITQDIDSANAFPDSQRTIIRDYLSYQFGGSLGLPFTYTTQQHGIAN